MIELWLSACLASAPTTCKDVTLGGPAGVTPFQCIIGAQTELAKWQLEHPGWTVTGWRCRRAGLFSNA